MAATTTTTMLLLAAVVCIVLGPGHSAEHNLTLPQSLLPLKTAIHYEKPPNTRLTTSAVGRNALKVCYYNHQKYQNGEEVGTEQPCLSCTCKKGILVCSLRVCPPVTPPTAPNTRSNGTHCQVVREGNACCPSLKCVPEKDHNQPNKESGNQEDFTVTPLITLNNSYFASSIRDDDKDLELSKGNQIVTASHQFERNTTVLQTVASSSFYENNDYLHHKQQQQQHQQSDVHQPNSPLLIAKANYSQQLKEAYLADLMQELGNHCYLDGTFYAEGSAILSTSFCEYCYCIRGKRMCIRPRCHLSILGCLPRYANEYACCPTSYACGNEALGATNSINNNNNKWSLIYTTDLVIGKNATDNNNNSNSLVDNLVIEPEARHSNESIEAMEAVTTTTTTTTTTPVTDKTSTPTTTASTPQVISSIGLVSSKISGAECLFNGVAFPQGDIMPADQDCSTCYCSNNGTRVCKRIECSLPQFEHNCIPITPEGHCCPLEFKCGGAPTPVVKNEEALYHNATTGKEAPSVDSSSGDIVISSTDATTLSPSMSSPTVGTTSSPLIANVTSANTTLPSNETKDIVEGRQLMETQPTENQATDTGSEPSKESLENVASFLNNLFNALKDAKKTESADTVNVYNTAVVNEDHQPIPPVPMPLNTLHETPRSNSDPMEMVKTQRDLPGPIYYNVRPHTHLNPAHNTLFTNGWRVIPVPGKHKLSPPPLLYNNRADMFRPLGGGGGGEQKAPEITSSTTPSTTTTTQVRVEVKKAEDRVDANTAKCMYQGHEYQNGELIPKSNNSCIICRCFYGQELCTEQKCPPPPSPECKAGPAEDYQQCCPVYTCIATKDDSMTVTTTTPKTMIKDKPMATPPLDNNNDISQTTPSMPANLRHLEPPQAAAAAPSVPFTGIPQPRINFPLDLIYGNRIHFPNNGPENKINIYNQRIPINRIINSNMKHGLPNQMVNINQLLSSRPSGPMGGHHPHHAHHTPINRFNGMTPNRLDHTHNNNNNNNNAPQHHVGGGHSPIRPLPQSPLQLGNTFEDKRVKTTAGHMFTPTSTPPPSTSMAHFVTSASVAPTTSGPMSSSTITTTSSTTTESPSSSSFDFLNPFQVSGCNIYGKMHNTGEEITELSDKCKICICSSFGVQCRKKC